MRQRMDGRRGTMPAVLPPPTPTRRVPYRTWPATLAIATAMAIYIGGLKTWDRHTPGSRELPVGETLVVGPARFVPAAGWEMDVARSRTGQSLTLFKTGHTFVVKANRWLGDEDGPIARQTRWMERVEHVRIEGDLTDFFTLWGLQGVTFAYYGPTTTGRFWQVVDTRRHSVVQVDFYGPAEGEAQALRDARDMLDSMDLEGGAS